jgi:hypothetical protein
MCVVTSSTPHRLLPPLAVCSSACAVDCSTLRMRCL